MSSVYPKTSKNKNLRPFHCLFITVSHSTLLQWRQLSSRFKELENTDRRRKGRVQAGTSGDHKIKLRFTSRWIYLHLKKKNWLCLLVFLLFLVFGTEIASFDLLRISLPNFYGFATISNQISGNQFSRSINLVGWLILAYYGETWYTVRNYPRKFVTLFFSLSGPIKTILPPLKYFSLGHDKRAYEVLSVNIERWKKKMNWLKIENF